MAEEPVQRFAARGIELPELERLPAAGTAAVRAFTASGEAAVRWWRRLREVAGLTGYWPVLVAEDGADVGPRDGTHAGGDALARAAGPDGAMLVNPQGQALSGRDRTPSRLTRSSCRKNLTTWCGLTRSRCRTGAGARSPLSRQRGMAGPGAARVRRLEQLPGARRAHGSAEVLG